MELKLRGLIQRGWIDRIGTAGKAQAGRLWDAARTSLAGIYERDDRGYRERTGVRVRKNISGTAVRLAAMLTFSLAILLVILAADYTVALEVRVDGETVGYAESEDTVRAAAESVEQYVTNFLGRSYSLDGEMEYSLAVVKKDVPEDPETFNNALLSGVREIRKLYRLEVDGKAVAAADQKETITGVLEDILNPVRELNPDAEVTFLQDVEITYEDTDVSLKKTGDELYGLLTSEVEPAVTYQTGEGDTVESVALQYGLTPQTLRSYNDMKEDEELTAGEKIVRRKAKSYLSVAVVRTEVAEETVPYEEVVREDPDRYTSYSSVETAGVDGVAQVTSRVTSVDGRMVGREEIARTVVTPSVTQVKVVGTKVSPVTGSFSSPFPGGIISSRYGRRGRYEFHTGLDLAGSYGSRILAADGGTVTYAGWKGNYGKLVIISHGNGVETWYAHCSAFLVGVGDQVEKGEAIAKVGTTGRTTGPHVHFEIRINGETVNPETRTSGLY